MRFLATIVLLAVAILLSQLPIWAVNHGADPGVVLGIIEYAALILAALGLSAVIWKLLVPRR